MHTCVRDDLRDGLNCSGDHNKIEEWLISLKFELRAEMVLLNLAGRARKINKHNNKKF